MEVGNLGLLPTDQGSKLSVNPIVPYRGAGQGQRALIAYLIIVHSVAQHLITVCLQEGALSRKYLIFAPGLLVVVVQEQHPGDFVEQVASSSQR